MIDLDPKYLETVQHILTEHAPECEVRAYGSRVTWTAKDYSDLELAVVGRKPFSLRRMRQLKEAFEESDLPIRVDVLDWHAIPDGFKKVIAEEYEVIQDGKLDKETAESEYSCQSWNQENNGWDLVKLGNVVSINPRRTLHRGKTALHVSMKDIEAFRREIASHSFKEFNGSATRFRNEDTLLARITPCLENGKTAYLNCLKANEVGHGSTEFIVLSGIEGKTDNLFIYYLARDPRFRAFAVHSMQGTTGRQRVAPDSLGLFEFALPPIEQQRRIANILGSLDDKIELNRQMNETMETMARAIFKSWFVDFDPVRAKMEGREPVGMDPETAALFPSKFQGSPLGEIPQGWESSKFANVMEVMLGGDWGKAGKIDNWSCQTLCTRGADIPVLQVGGLGNMPIRYLKTSSLAKRQLRSGDLVIEISGGSPTQSTGRTVLIDEGLLDELDCPLVCSNFCRLIRLKSRNMSNLVYLWLRWLYSNDIFFQYENGTTGIKNLAFTVFAEEQDILIPADPVINAFNQKIEPLLKMLHLNSQQSRTLSEIREVLLPKLLSGEIRVV